MFHKKFVNKCACFFKHLNCCILCMIYVELFHKEFAERGGSKTSELLCSKSMGRTHEN